MSKTATDVRQSRCADRVWATISYLVLEAIIVSFSFGWATPTRWSGYVWALGGRLAAWARSKEE